LQRYKKIVICHIKTGARSSPTAADANEHRERADPPRGASADCIGQRTCPRALPDAYAEKRAAEQRVQAKIQEMYNCFPEKIRIL
jgi:hypothetical protein